MRRPLTFDCDGATLGAMVHPAGGTVGVVIVTGGVQTRAGSHRGFVQLADRLAAAGCPTLRFDRRGVGDSDGEDPGFRNSAPDIAAAADALRRSFPQVEQVVGWGLCDAASALGLHAAAIGLDGLVLANPWTRDSDDLELPPPNIVARRYLARLRNPRELARLARGRFDWRKAIRGLRRLAAPEAPSSLARDLAAGLGAFDGPILFILADADATAQACHALLQRVPLRHVCSRSNVGTVVIPGATHTFPRRQDAEAVADATVGWIAERFDLARVPKRI